MGGEKNPEEVIFEDDGGLYCVVAFFFDSDGGVYDRYWACSFEFGIACAKWK